MAIVFFDSGNNEVTVEAESFERWEKEGHVRNYYTLDIEGDSRKSFTKLWEVIEGKPSEFSRSVEVDGRTYGYEIGSFANSETKRNAIERSVIKLVIQLQNEEKRQLN